MKEKAPAEFELLLNEWAEWKMDGCGGPLGYPSGASFTRNAGGGLPDYVPDVDRALVCGAVNDAIVSVGGIHQGVLETIYFWPGMAGIRKATEKYKVSKSTIYNWLDDSRFLVWQEYEKMLALKNSEKPLDRKTGTI
ncbi:MAG: hypothetical protein LBI35_00810 [Burkholderiales bacterium]|jgi:hypothetical protein|nr:hypothetical protein [Burkholderiales bacterium]